MKKLLLSFVLLTATTVFVSAQCTETYAPSAFLPATTSYDAGQSFTAPCSGVLNYVHVNVSLTSESPTHSQFWSMGPTFTSLTTDEASMAKCLAQGHKS